MLPLLSSGTSNSQPLRRITTRTSVGDLFSLFYSTPEILSLRSPNQIQIPRRVALSLSTYEIPFRCSSRWWLLTMGIYCQYKASIVLILIVNTPSSPKKTDSIFLCGNILLGTTPDEFVCLLRCYTKTKFYLCLCSTHVIQNTTSLQLFTGFSPASISSANISSM